MKPKILVCLALVLGAALFSCANISGCLARAGQYLLWPAPARQGSWCFYPDTALHPLLLKCL